MSDILGAIILAAGKGTRFQDKKQFIPFLGKPMWKHSYDTALKVIPKNNIVRVGIDIEGGKTRTKSVIAGMKSLSSNTDRVLIIESARPLVTEEQLLQLSKDKSDSTTFVMPLINTVIMRDGNYIDRDKMYELLTPQAFNYKLLLEALNSGKYEDMTDETRIMFEHFGINPKFIETGQNLLKVTYQRDIFILESLYELMKNNSKINKA